MHGKNVGGCDILTVKERQGRDNFTEVAAFKLKKVIPNFQLKV